MLRAAKAITAFGGAITLVIGLIFLGITIWAFTNSALAFNQYGFLVFVLIADIIIIIGAVLGIIGARK